MPPSHYQQFTHENEMTTSSMIRTIGRGLF